MATTKTKASARKRTVKSTKAAVKNTRKSATTAKKAVKAKLSRLDGLTDLLNKLEVEAENIAKRVIDRAEEASTELRDSVEELIEKVRSNGIYTVAADTKEDIEREVRRLVEDVVDRAKDVELMPFNTANRDRIIQEAKRNLEDIRDRLTSTEWLARARVSASHTKDQVLGILSIPSQGELSKLQRKITSLEKRLSTLNKKAA